MRRQAVGGEDSVSFDIKRMIVLFYFLWNDIAIWLGITALLKSIQIYSNKYYTNTYYQLITGRYCCCLQQQLN